jgi:hypothetical protein
MEALMTKTTMALVAAVLALGSVSAQAQGTTCKAQADEKKLARAAKNSFLKKCGDDANKACAADSTEKKLGGAAKSSHMKKCVGDKIGV